MAQFTFGDPYRLSSAVHKGTAMASYVGSTSAIMASVNSDSTDDMLVGHFTTADTSVDLLSTSDPLWIGDVWVDNNSRPQLADLRSDYFALAYEATADGGRIRLIEVTGGSPVDRGSTWIGVTGADILSVDEVEPAKFIVAYRDPATDTGYVQCYTRTTNTLSGGSAVAFTSAGDAPITINITKTDTDEFVVSWSKDAGDKVGRVVAGTVPSGINAAGRVISIGNNYTFTGSQCGPQVGCSPQPNNFVLFYTDVPDNRSGKVISGTVVNTNQITLGSAEAISGGNEIDSPAITRQSSDTFVVMYTDEDDGDKGKLCQGAVNYVKGDFQLKAVENFILDNTRARLSNWIDYFENNRIGFMYTDIDSGGELYFAMADVASNAYVNESNILSSPIRKFYIGTSDYSDRVLAWPTIDRDMERLQSAYVSIELSNTDGHFNGFYTNLYTIVNTCQLDLGFAYDNGSEDIVTVFIGYLEDMDFKKGAITLSAKDVVYKLLNKKVADQTNVVSFANEIPSEIAWTLLTSYGQLDNTATASNNHIDYNSFLSWANTLSTDNILAHAHYSGQQVTEAIDEIARMTDSQIWAGREGRILFNRNSIVSSTGLLFSGSEYIDNEISLRLRDIVNKQYVWGDYDVDSGYHQIEAFDVTTYSVDSYGLFEQVIKSNTFWYTNSANCINIAQRVTMSKREPNRRFSVYCPFKQREREIGDYVRLADDFYGVTSENSWMIARENINMENGIFTFGLDGAFSLTPFTLDVSTLDGPDVLS